MPNHPIFTLFSRILEVPVAGVINQEMTKKIATALTKTRLTPIEIITVPINSGGGSLTQANNISDLLRNYSEKKNIPVYCFAEDQCMGAANVILVSGAKSFASPMSLMGGFESVWGNLNLSKISQKYKIQREQVSGGENKAKFDQFKQMSPQAIEFTKKHLKMLEQQLISTVMYRRRHFNTFKNFQEQVLRQKMFNRPLISGIEAKRYGLVHELLTREQFKHQKFRGKKTINALKQPQVNGLNIFSKLNAKVLSNMRSNIY